MWNIIKTTLIFFLLSTLSGVFAAAVIPSFNERGDLFLGLNGSELQTVFSGKPLLSIDHPVDDYGQYFKEIFDPVSYDTGYYIKDYINGISVSAVFLFYQNRIFMCAYQLIGNADLLGQFKKVYLSAFGRPSGAEVKRHISDKELWTSGNILCVLNYSQKPLGYTYGDNTVSSVPFPSLAFTRIEGIDPQKSIELWHRMRKYNLLTEEGIVSANSDTPIDTEIDEFLSFIDLEPRAKELIKVMLISTYYGELNVVFIDRARLRELLSISLKTRQNQPVNRMIDVHCHIDTDAVAPVLEQLFSNASPTKVISAGIKPSSWSAHGRLKARYPQLQVSLGLHPFFSQQEGDWLDQLRDDLQTTGALAVGEIGLDYTPEYRPQQERQQEVFRLQLKMASELGLPVVIHCRKAFSGLWSLLDQYEFPALIFHAFSGGVDDLKKALDRKAYLSYGFPLTYNNNRKQRAMIQQTPLPRILLETDAPWPLPDPAHSQTATPLDIRLVYNAASQVLKTELSQLEAQIEENICRIWPAFPV